MTRAALLLAALPLLTARPAAAEPPLLDPLSAALLHHAWALTPVPETRLVRWFGEVCGEEDPGRRAAAAEAARAPLREAGRRASATLTWRLPLRETLGGYEPTRGGFPTALRDGSVIRFGPPAYCGEDLTYLVVLENGRDHQVVPASRDDAVAFVRRTPSREVLRELEVEVTGALAGPEPALRVRILRARTLDARTGVAVAAAGR